MAVPSETKGPALRALCIGHHQSPCTPNTAGLGTITTPKTPLAAHRSCQRAPSETIATFRNKAFCTHCIGDHHTPCRQKTAGSGTIDHLETTDRAAARAPDTRRKRRSLRNSSTFRHGGPVAATAQRLRLRNHVVFTPFLPRFYPTVAPCRVKCRVSTPFLPRFYPVAPISFYPYG